MWLEAVLGKLRNAGEDLELRGVLNFVGFSISPLYHPDTGKPIGWTVANGGGGGGGGGPGADGASSVWKTAASFTQPALGSPVLVQFVSTTNMPAGVGLFVEGGGYYRTSTPVDSAHVVLTLDVAASGAPPTSTVASDALAVATGPFPVATAAGDVMQLDGSLQPIFGGVPTALSVTSFATTGGTLKRAGDTVTNPSFTATYNQLPGSAALIDNAGNSSAPLTTPFASFSYLHAYTYAVVHTLTFTLSASRTPGGTTSRAASISWGFDVYHGAAAACTTEANIKALAHDVLATSRIVPNFAAAASGGDFDWFAIPSSYGTPSFTDVTTGFSVPFDNTGTVSVTNSNGVTVNYDIWRSHFAGLGTAGTIVIKVT